MKIRSRTTRTVGISTGKSARRPTVSPEVARGEGPQDRVQISDRGAEIQHARSLALAAPEVRAEMVDEIVGMIERGEYQVEGRQVVPKMVRDHVLLAGG